jgi:hypothetical protein
VLWLREFELESPQQTTNSNRIILYFCFPLVYYNKKAYEFLKNNTKTKRTENKKKKLCLLSSIFTFLSALLIHHGMFLVQNVSALARCQHHTVRCHQHVSCSLDFHYFVCIFRTMCHEYYVLTVIYQKFHNYCSFLHKYSQRERPVPKRRRSVRDRFKIVFVLARI